MARRSDHNRQELYSIILTAAHDIAEKEGLRGLTARRIADKIGYAPGTIYNVFVNLDDLIFHLRGETLDELHDYILPGLIDGQPEAILINIANNYISYVCEHPRLWSLMFEHRYTDDVVVPEWYHKKTLRLLSLVEKALTSFFSKNQKDEQLHHAQVLWASIHGICSLQIEGKLVMKEPAEAMVQSLITKYVKGLRYELADFQVIPIQKHTFE